MITVWGRRNSVNVQKVLWALEELDVPYTRENVGGSFGGNQDADFLSMNPMGLVPVIRDGDVTMFESNAIVRYLAARFRAGVLRPSDHKSLAMAEQWMEWTQVNVSPAVTALFINRVRSLPEARDVAAAAAAAAAAEASLLQPLHPVPNMPPPPTCLSLTPTANACNPAPAPSPCASTSNAA